jgi:hypothetical protein
MTAPRWDAKGPFIVWEDKGCEGWGVNLVAVDAYFASRMTGPHTGAK